MIDINVYTDESGITSGCPCYTIGLLTIPSNYLENFNNKVEILINESGIRGELKWQKIRKSAGKINLCIKLTKLILSSPCSFHCIVVKKDLYRKWHVNEEEAFFTTYDYLLSNSLKRKGKSIHVRMDQKSTSYKKQDEVVKIISNHMLKEKTGKSPIKTLDMEDSKEHLALQAVDILTGAVNTGHWLYIDEHAQIDLAKKIACKRIALILGWDKLIHDTFPNDQFNVWHFPTEYRGTPSSKHVKTTSNIPLVTREQFEKWSSQYA